MQMLHSKVFAVESGLMRKRATLLAKQTAKSGRAATKNPVKAPRKSPGKPAA
jgi:hypothetical protein